MRPYIHHVYLLDNDNPLKEKEFTVITGKKNFQNWAVEHYEKNPDQKICFRLEDWEHGLYYKVLPYVYRKGKNKGRSRSTVFCAA